LPLYILGFISISTIVSGQNANMPKGLDEKDSNEDGDKKKQHSVVAGTMCETDRPLAAIRTAKRPDERNQRQSDAFYNALAPRTFEGHRT